MSGLRKRIASILIYIFDINYALLRVREIVQVLDSDSDTSEPQQFPYSLLIYIWSGSLRRFVRKAKRFLVEKIEEIKRPEASAENVEVKDVSLGSITFHAKFIVSNPYIVPIPIGEISYTLKSNNKEIAVGKISDPGSVNGNDTTTLDIFIKAPYNEFMKLLGDISSDWDIDYEFDVGAAFDLPLIGDIFVLDYCRGEIKLPTLSDLFK